MSNNFPPCCKRQPLPIPPPKPAVFDICEITWYAKIILDLYARNNTATTADVVARYPNAILYFGTSTSTLVPQYLLVDCITHWVFFCEGTTNESQALAQVLSSTLGQLSSAYNNFSPFVALIGDLIWSSIKPIIGNDGRLFVLTGHSYGGSLAQAVAVKNSRQGDRREQNLVTFGAPKASGEQVRQLISSTMPSRMIIHDFDPAPFVPPFSGDNPWVRPLVGNTIANNWDAFVWPSVPYRLSDDGKLVYNSFVEPDLAVVGLGIVTDWLLQRPISAGSPHSLQNYYNALNLICANQGMLAGAFVSVAFDDDPAYGNFYVKIPSGCSSVPPGNYYLTWNGDNKWYYPPKDSVPPTFMAFFLLLQVGSGNRWTLTLVDQDGDDDNILAYVSLNPTYTAPFVMTPIASSSHSCNRKLGNLTIYPENDCCGCDDSAEFAIQCTMFGRIEFGTYSA